MKDKVILITGANSGIGKATAELLAKKQATIYLVCRNQSKGETARKEIIQKTGNDNIHLRICDLSSMESIKEYGLKLRAELSHIDVLINNAGAMFGSRLESSDGLEMTFALNHIGYFLHTHYLLDLVRKGEDKRIVNVSSMGHKMIQKIDFDDLQFQKNYKQMYVYCQSKLFNIYFTQILAERLKEENITVNCLHPGVIGSNFGSGGSTIFKTLMSIARPFLTSTKKGAATSVYLASSDEVNDISGAYFDKCKIASITPLAKDRDAAHKIWNISMEMCKLKEYGKV